MLTVVWINTIFLIAAAIVQGIVLYAIARELRKNSETLSRVEQLSLAALQRLTPQQEPQA